MSYGPRDVLGDMLWREPPTALDLRQVADDLEGDGMLELAERLRHAADTYGEARERATDVWRVLRGKAL